MQIGTLSLKNFRNFENLTINFSNGINIIYGANGQGKTNILESIYICGSGKSHKGAHEEELINNKSREAHIKGEFFKETGKERIDVHLKKQGIKGIAINKIPIKKLTELYGRIYIVMFSSEDLDIIKRGPAQRRRFLDMGICRQDAVYTQNLISYNKILLQRKELLKSLSEKGKNRASLYETLDIWDLQLSKYGTLIIKARRKFIEELNEILGDINGRISGGKEELQLKYAPSKDEESLYEELLKARDKDIFYKQTSAGPHRDDLEFLNGNEDLKIYGSNGQQRTCAISLKLSELELIGKNKREKPVLLLDDVLSELDRERQKKLLDTIKDTQTVITCTGIDEFVESEIGRASRFHINGGMLSEQ